VIAVLADNIVMRLRIKSAEISNLVLQRLVVFDIVVAIPKTPPQLANQIVNGFIVTTIDGLLSFGLFL
jgi:hypothetical protein